MKHGMKKPKKPKKTDSFEPTPEFTEMLLEAEKLEREAHKSTRIGDPILSGTLIAMLAVSKRIEALTLVLTKMELF